MSMSEFLADLRDDRGWTNRQVAERLDIPRSEGSVINWMCGSDQPGRAAIRALARLFNVTEQEIRSGRRTPQGDPSEPPVQPTKGPPAPPKRGGPKGPKRAQSRSAA